MKKVYVLLFSMLITALSYGQVYLYEDFSEGTFPAGWTKEGVPAQWSISPSTSAGGEAPELKFTYIQQNTTSRVISPVIDMTGIDDAVLSLKHFYDYYSAGVTIGVATRFGTGEWQVAWQLAPSSNQGPKTQIVQLTDIGQADFQFSIFISGNLYNVDYWFIDDIKLFSPLALDAVLSSVDVPKFVEGGTSFSLKGKVMNEGTTNITSYDVSYTVNGGPEQVYSVTGINLALGAIHNFTHNIPINVGEPGPYEIVVTVDNVNSGQDLNMENNTITKLVSAVPYLPAKKVLAEEATGTWCGWCPRGTCNMNYMAETYPETWIGVAVHNGDPMVVADYDGAMGGIIPGFAGYPSVTTDRTSGDSDPSDLEAGYLRRINAISPATIAIVNAAWNPETRELSFDLESEFVAAVNSELRFGVIFTEDGLSGTSSQWAQANYYSGGGQGVMCGFETLPNPVPAAQMVYDHVARKILDTPYGTPNSLPTEIAAGETVSYHYSYVLPDTWNYDNLHVIGFLVDSETKEILNAENVISSWVGVESGLFDKAVTVYPNPAGDFTKIDFTLNQASKARVDVYDMFGKLVYSVKESNLPAGKNSITVQSNTFTNGMYVMKLTIGNNVVSRKISIIK
jgi:hypothetical protein